MIRLEKINLSLRSKTVILGLASILLFSIFLIVGCLYYLFLFKTLAAWALAGILYSPCDYGNLQSLSKECSFKDKTSEMIFRQHIWEEIPPEVTDIQGVEGAVLFSEGPAFVRFKANDQLITEILRTGYANHPYEIIPCTTFYEVSSNYLVKNFPEEFEWWKPFEISTPVCYHVQGFQGDDSKYLLTDPDNHILYFYRTATCGLCSD